MWRSRGCHATGFLTLAAPLVSMGIAAPDYPFTAHSVTGYSGGGKKMIAAYEAEDRPASYDGPRQYALGQKHKHLPEMQKIAGLAYAPVFNPIVADYFCGMVVTVPLHTRLLQKKLTPSEVAAAMAEYYAGQRFITVHPHGETPEDGTLDALALAGTNNLEIFVFGTDEQIVLASRFDNLGKGASGAAVQCMNSCWACPRTRDFEKGNDEMKEIQNGVCAPKGFRAAGVWCGIRKNKTKSDLAMIVSDTLCTAAGVYTKNKVKGAPLVVTKNHLENGHAQAVICNSGNANTCAPNGMEIAEETCALAAQALGISPEDMIVGSTGVIGKEMSIEPFQNGIPQLVEQLSYEGSARRPMPS